MDVQPEHLLRGLEALGELLEHRGQSYDLVVVGASAMVLGGLPGRPTEDVDVVGQFKGGRVVPRKPFPRELQAAIEEVGRALGLPLHDTHGKDWLNPGPSMLARFGDLPPGLAGRLTPVRFGALTLRIAARIDLIHLKLWAATDVRRPTVRRETDLADLRVLGATRTELVDAARWVLSRDGRPETFAVEVQPVLRRLGHDVEVLDDE